MGLTKLSDADAKRVAKEVALLLSTPKEVVANELEVQEIADPATKAYHETEVELIKQLANPRLVQVVTKRGARIHNMTENALNALHDLGRERKIFKAYM